MWTFGKKLAAGFFFAFALLVIIGTVAYRGLTSLSETSAWITHTHEVLEHVSGVFSLLKDAETSQRGFVITDDEAFLEPYRAAESKLPAMLKDLRELVTDNPVQQRRIDVLEPVVAEKFSEMAKVIEARRNSGFEGAEKIVLAGAGKRTMDDLRAKLGQMESDERRLLKVRTTEGEAAAILGRQTLSYGTLFALMLMIVAGVALTSSLTGQVGSAIQHIQSSSVELQAAANQQVTGSKQQAAAMTEITMTITELLATSRQIAESAQRVSKVASDTAGAARGGDTTMQRTQESVLSIRRQVDLIVNHMLELGRKSQQIGGILEIINELSEQTNILSINATIEAAGAGEMGRRFSVVADEIRKLSDRVGGSTKEIRTLVDEIRAAVNTTVMATESGSKAVDAGSRQFGEVAESFSRIAGLVVTTTDAAREIELSTKQQASAVEQVNVAVSNVAQATRESESSSAQTLQTASQLATLSRELTRIIRAEARA